MPTPETLKIDTVGKASRFLCNIGGDEGFDEAVRRVESRSSDDIVMKLRELTQWVRGADVQSPDPEFEFIGTVVKHTPGDIHTSQSIAVIDSALADARALSDHIRSGVLTGALYLMLLLGVGTLVAFLWIFNIAPQFESLYQGMSSELPALSHAFLDAPWLIFLVLAGLGGLLVMFTLGMRHLAARVETIGPIGPGWKRVLAGRSLGRAHANWRALTLARAWVAGGALPAEALRQSVGVLGTDRPQADDLEAGIGLAADLGAGKGELDYMTLASVGRFRDAIEAWQAVTVRALQLLVAIAIGLIIVAIYLPIFKLGAIV